MQSKTASNNNYSTTSSLLPISRRIGAKSIKTGKPTMQQKNVSYCVLLKFCTFDFYSHSYIHTNQFLACYENTINFKHRNSNAKYLYQVLRMLTLIYNTYEWSVIGLIHEI